MSDKKINEGADEIKALYEYCASLNIPFLYAAAPRKEYNTKIDYSLENNEKANFDAFIGALDEKNVPYFNIAQAMLDEGYEINEMFYKTDHHWKAETGFWVTKKLCRELDERYGFETDEEKLNEKNYNFETWKKYFKGSFFQTENFFHIRPDDFTIITPKFKTDLTVTNHITGDVRQGEFKDTVLFDKKLSHTNIYSHYSDGDQAKQEFKNNLTSNGKTIVLIRISYACVVSPFLALQTADLYNLDIRQKNINAYDEIKAINPDYVIVLYNGVRGGGDGELEFNRKIK